MTPPSHEPDANRARAPSGIEPGRAVLRGTWRIPHLRGMERPALLLLMVLYIGLLKWLYIVAVVPAWGYTGLRYQFPGPMAEGLTWLLALTPVLWLPVDFDRPSRLPLWFQYLVIYVPTTFLPLYNIGPGGHSVWPLVLAILAALAIVQTVTSLPRAEIPTLGISHAAYRAILLGMAAVLLLPLVFTFGMPTHIPTLSEVYDVRADYKATLAGTSILVVYAVAWFGRVAVPLLLIEGVVYRKWVLAILGFLGAIYTFSLSGMKTIAASGFFLIALRILYRPKGRRMALWLSGAFVGGMLISVIVDMMLGRWILVGALIRRGLMIPGILNGYYYQFFSTHPHALLGASFLRALAPYPYDSPPPIVIGQVYFGSTLVNANVNVWGDAFLNFGLAGIIVFAVALGLVLWVFDSVSIRRPAVLTLLMLGVPALTLTNSALPTTFLTDGLALTFMMAALLPAAQGASDGAGAASSAQARFETTGIRHPL